MKLVKNVTCDVNYTYNGRTVIVTAFTDVIGKVLLWNDKSLALASESDIEMSFLMLEEKLQLTVKKGKVTNISKEN